jgi:hypothetical protein
VTETSGIPVPGYAFTVYAFWLGIRWNVTLQSFNWLDNSPVDFYYWANNEPSYIILGERYRENICIILTIYASNPAYRERIARWADTECEMLVQGVFCMKDARVSENSTNTTQTFHPPKIETSMTYEEFKGKMAYGNYTPTLNLSGKMGIFVDTVLEKKLDP